MSLRKQTVLSNGSAAHLASNRGAAAIAPWERTVYPELKHFVQTVIYNEDDNDQVTLGEPNTVDHRDGLLFVPILDLIVYDAARVADALRRRFGRRADLRHEVPTGGGITATLIVPDRLPESGKRRGLFGWLFAQLFAFTLLNLATWIGVAGLVVMWARNGVEGVTLLRVTRDILVVVRDVVLSVSR